MQKFSHPFAKILLLLLLLAATFISGIVFSNKVLRSDLTPQTITEKSTERRESGYTFINPLLECEYLDNQGNSNLKDLKAGVEEIIKQQQNQEISVYYRDLLNGPWYGYGETDAFAPQSLLKLPVIFAYLKIADEDPTYLSKKIVYNKENDSNLPSENNLKLGETYSIEFLIERTLKLSDNQAFDLLVANIPSKYLIKVHEDLGITYPSQSTPTDFMTVKSYSSIFRVLYNSSYLSRKNSEKVLSLLSGSEFKDGLVAGVPKGVLVAHKYGLKNQSSDQSTSQLHDCGIIYHPQRPYLLCVMTKGSDQIEQTKTIRLVSEAVYTIISKDLHQ